MFHHNWYESTKLTIKIVVDRNEMFCNVLYLNWALSIAEIRYSELLVTSLKEYPGNLDGINFCR